MTESKREQYTPRFKRKPGNTTYAVKVHFSKHMLAAKLYPAIYIHRRKRNFAKHTKKSIRKTPQTQKSMPHFGSFLRHFIHRKLLILTLKKVYKIRVSKNVEFCIRNLIIGVYIIE